MQTAFGDRTARKNLLANKPDVFILPSINPSEKKAVTPRISHATMVPRVFIDDEKVPFEFEIRHSTTTNKIINLTVCDAVDKRQMHRWRTRKDVSYRELLCQLGCCCDEGLPI